MRPVAAALALLVVPACASSGRGDEAAHALVVVVPGLTVAPPPKAPASPSPPAATSLEPAANPACVLSATPTELARPIPLRVEDSAPFYHVHGAGKLEVRLASPWSTARAARSDLEIIGHVKLSDVPVRLRSGALVDGYLRVNYATLRDGDPAHLELVVAPPWFLKPVKDPVVPVDCVDLALASGTGRVETSFGRKPVDLRIGKPIAVRATPGGPVVATISLPKPDPGQDEPSVDAYELERRDAEVRVRVEWDETDVEGWVSRGDLSPHADSNMFGLLGTLAGGEATIALASAAPLFVRTGNRVVRVGEARPGTFDCVIPASAKAREIELGFDGPFGGLGLGFGGSESGPRPAEAKLFLAPTRGEACVEGTGKAL